MKRIAMFLPEALIERLKALSEREGQPMSVLIREAIKAYLKKKEKEQ
jgi:predicted DNA-binding protein